MQILVRRGLVVDYCANNSYICTGSTVVCQDKGCNFEGCSIVTVSAVPTDIEDFEYYYEAGKFTKGTAKVPTASDRAVWDGKAKIVTGSYVGTGTYGQSNPNSLTFDFAPKVVIMLGQKGIHDSTPYWNDFPLSQMDFNTKMVSDALSTTYQKQFGFAHTSPGSSYGKKSADCKTVSWYSTYGAQGQMNAIDMTYYYMAIG